MSKDDRKEYAGQSKIDVIEAALLKNVAGAGFQDQCSVDICRSDVPGMMYPGEDRCKIDTCMVWVDPYIEQL